MIPLTKLLKPQTKFKTMITRKLILWTNYINLVCIVLIILCGLIFKIGDSLFIYIPLGVILFVSMINSLFAIDNKTFLTDYDSIKSLKADTETRFKTADKYTSIIGQHEAIKLWANAIGIGDQIEKVTSDLIKDATSGIEFTDDYIKNKASEILSEVKNEAKKVDTGIKEVFEEKTVNNISAQQPNPITSPVSEADTNEA